MQNQNQIPDPNPVPKKRGRPPKSRIETEENEDLEVDEGKEETGGYPDHRANPFVNEGRSGPIFKGENCV